MRSTASNVSFPTVAPRRTAVMGVTRTREDREVASSVLRSHCQVTNMTTDPAKARNRIAPIPSGQEGTRQVSLAVTERAARLAAPTAIAPALNVTGSVPAPQRLRATVATAAQVAESTIAIMGKALSATAVGV